MEPTCSVNVTEDMQQGLIFKKRKVALLLLMSRSRNNPEQPINVYEN
jgi:hypothetical protein